MEKFKIIKKNLDFSKTLDYFLDHINGGKHLDKIILQNIPFQKGRFFVFLPAKAKLKQLYQFSWGEINPTYSTNKVYHTSAGKAFIPQVRVTTFKQASQFIKCFLDASDNHIALCEDAIRLHKDPHLSIINVPNHFYFDQVYYSLTSKNSLEEINNTINQTEHIWHSLVVLSSGVKLHDQLTEEDFLSICSHAQYILTSVHDGENILVWERNNYIAF